MFKHVVSFRLKSDKKDMLPKAKQMILSLADMPQVKSIESWGERDRQLTLVRFCYNSTV